MARIEKVLLATDGSPASELASEQAIDLATQVEARLLVISVLGTSARPSEAHGEDSDSRDSLATRASAIVQRAKAAGADAEFLVWEGDPGEAIVAAADSEAADIIVVGSHGTARSWWFGAIWTWFAADPDAAAATPLTHDSALPYFV
jgi:nucleotide-binding universal stress UspA family protein